VFYATAIFLANIPPGLSGYFPEEIKLQNGAVDLIENILVYVGLAAVFGLVIGLMLIIKGSNKNITLSLKKQLKTGWDLTKKHFWLLVLSTLFIFAVTVGTEIPAWIAPENRLIESMTSLFGTLINMYLELGLVAMTLAIVQKKKATFNNLFVGLTVFSRFVLGSIMYGILVGFGFILFIVPGVYFSLKYGLFPFYLLEKNTKLFDAFNMSAHVTRGAKMDILLILFVVELIHMLSVLLLGVGTLVSVPFSAVVMAGIYLTLNKKSPPLPVKK